MGLSDIKYNQEDYKIFNTTVEQYIGREHSETHITVRNVKFDGKQKA